MHVGIYLQLIDAEVLHAVGADPFPCPLGNLQEGHEVEGDQTICAHDPATWIAHLRHMLQKSSSSLTSRRRIISKMLAPHQGILLSELGLRWMRKLSNSTLQKATARVYSSREWLNFKSVCRGREPHSACRPV